MSLNSTQPLSTVLDRARANLNDQGAQIWKDLTLLPHSQNAYSKLWMQIVKIVKSQGENVLGSPYSPDLQYNPEVTITNIATLGGVATATTSQFHNFVVNQSVTIQGNSASDLNGTVTVTGANYTSQTFTYATAATDSGTGGTATGVIVSLQSIVPVDMWVPVSLEYRTSANEEWTRLNRVHALPSQEVDPPDTLTNWEYRMRNIFVNQAVQNQLLRLRYVSLFPSLIVNQSDPSAQMLLVDNCIETLGYYTAGSAYASRGQLTQAKAMNDEGDLFAKIIRAVLILNMQQIATRSQRFSSGGTDLQWNAQVESSLSN